MLAMLNLQIIIINNIHFINMSNTVYLVPLFTCKQHFPESRQTDTGGDYMPYLFCFMEKVLLILTFASIVLISH